MCKSETNNEIDVNSSQKTIESTCQEDNYKKRHLYDLLKEETELQQKRVWFFGVLITAILTGWYLVNESKDIDCDYKQKLKIILPFLASVIALIQCFLNRGSKYWFNYLHSQISKLYQNNKCDEIFYDNVNYPNYLENLKSTGFLGVNRKVKIPVLFIFFADFVLINCLMLFIYELCKNLNICVNIYKVDLVLIIYLVINILVVIIAFLPKLCKWGKIWNIFE